MRGDIGLFSKSWPGGIICKIDFRDKREREIENNTYKKIDDREREREMGIWEKNSRHGGKNELIKIRIEFSLYPFETRRMVYRICIQNEYTPDSTSNESFCHSPKPTTRKNRRIFLRFFYLFFFFSSLFLFSFECKSNRTTNQTSWNSRDKVSDSRQTCYQQKKTHH